jgi:hypothetical protein
MIDFNDINDFVDELIQMEELESRNWRDGYMTACKKIQELQAELKAYKSMAAFLGTKVSRDTYDFACKLIYEETDLSIANKIVGLLDKDFGAKDARIAELEAVLKNCADDLEQEINARYDRTPDYPFAKADFDRNMQPVIKARQLLTK